MIARPTDLTILLLPSKSFQVANAGAISLSVRDFVRFSGYADPDHGVLQISVSVGSLPAGLPICSWRPEPC